jgi:hypothetical protein
MVVVGHLVLVPSPVIHKLFPLLSIATTYSHLENTPTPFNPYYHAISDRTKQNMLKKYQCLHG